MRFICSYMKYFFAGIFLILRIFAHNFRPAFSRSKEIHYMTHIIVRDATCEIDK